MKKSASQESKSLKTFFVYSGIVLFFIFIALLVKMFFILQASKFDGRHDFVLSVAQDQKVKQIIVFHPAKLKTSLVELEGNGEEGSTVNQRLGFIPDATIDAEDAFTFDQDISKTLRAIGLHYNSVTTNLTIIDVVRLALLSHRASQEETKSDLNDFFVNDTIASENISIQIINATGESGMGKRLENVLSGLGCNVVSIITSAKKEKLSSIQYFGEDSYTLKKIKGILKFPTKELDTKQIADIIIVIGEDDKNSKNF